MCVNVSFCVGNYVCASVLRCVVVLGYLKRILSHLVFVLMFMYVYMYVCMYVCEHMCVYSSV